MGGMSERPPDQDYGWFWKFVIACGLAGGVYYVYKLPGGYTSSYRAPRDSKQDQIDQLRDQVYFLRKELQSCKRGY